MTLLYQDLSPDKAFKMLRQACVGYVRDNTEDLTRYDQKYSVVIAQALDAIGRDYTIDVDDAHYVFRAIEGNAENNLFKVRKIA